MNTLRNTPLTNWTRRVGLLLLLPVAGRAGGFLETPGPTAALIQLEAQNVSSADATILTDLLRDELTGTGRIALIEKQRITDVLAEQAFQQTGCTDTVCAVKLGRILNVRLMILGSYSVLEGTKFLAVRMVNVESGRIEASVSRKGLSPDEVDVTLREMADELTAGLAGEPRRSGGIPAAERGLRRSSRARHDHADVTYCMLFTGASVGSMIDFHAESVFKNPADQPNPGKPLWTADAEEVNTAMSAPSFGARMGMWTDWYGGDFEISYLAHHVVKQTAYYDAQGVSYVPQYDIYAPTKLGDVPLPDNFQTMHSVAFGGNFYLHLPGRVIQPYAGLGAALLVNHTTSDYSGPATYLAHIEGVKLNSTSLGVSIQLLAGARLPLGERWFAYAEFRPARNYFRFVSGDRYQRERDRFTLQTFQGLAGIGYAFQ